MIGRPNIEVDQVSYRDEKWDRRFLELAKHISSWSKDPSTKVGSVIVTDENLVVGLGYNGFPRGVNDYSHRYKTRDIKYSFVVHAEVNAILMAGRDKCIGATLYTWPGIIFPNICSDCCKVAIQAGIRCLVSYMPDMNDPRAERWSQSAGSSYQMLDEANVVMRTIKQTLEVTYGDD